MIEMVPSANKPHDSTVINYDRHLDCDTLSRHVAQPEIVHKLRSLMGDDIMCWKTNIFEKEPGDSGNGLAPGRGLRCVGETTTASYPSLRYTEETTAATQELTVGRPSPRRARSTAAYASSPAATSAGTTTSPSR